MNKILLILILSAVVITLNQCDPKDNNIPPVISFKTGTQFTKNNAVVMVGYPLHFGIQARGNSANITNLTIKKRLENGDLITVMDTGLNSINLDIEKVFYQNVEDKVTWEFSVMDRNRLSSTISLVIYKDSNSKFGGIYHHPSIKMGYQKNMQYGHFLDPHSGEVYFDDSATVYHNNIDILCYFIHDGTPSPVLSSPGEMDNFSTDAQTFYPCIINWDKRNYTLWDISVDDNPVSSADFDRAHNDSLLIVSYHEVWGKKKFKWAVKGTIIPFLTESGKKGLIKVVHADEKEDGFMEFELKIQQ